MSKEQKHIIDKLSFSIQTDDLRLGRELHSQLSGFIQDDLMRDIESILDQSVSENELIHIDRLNLDLTVDKTDLFPKLKEKFTEELLRALKDAPKENMSNKNGGGEEGIIRISRIQKKENVLLFVLENGHLPWNGSSEEVKELYEPENWIAALGDNTFVQDLVKLFQYNPEAITRFILQFQEHQFMQFLEKIDSRLILIQNEINTFSNTLSSNSKVHFYQLLFHSTQIISSIKIKIAYNLLTHTMKNEGLDSDYHLLLLKPLLRKLIPNIADIIEVSFEEKKEYSQKEKARLEEIPSDGIIVDNAGLILLHPFLKQLFSKFQLLDESNLLIPKQKRIAIQLLHFLASGKDTFYEWEMAFEKFLCAMPFQMPIERESLLNEEMKEEAEVLLQSVVQHWTALKNTSTDGLRQAFLWRKGKLSQTNTGYELIMEHNSIDILLEQLPWGYSTIHLPWLDSLLFTQWE